MKTIITNITPIELKDGTKLMRISCPPIGKSQNNILIYEKQDYFNSKPLTVGQTVDLWWNKEKKKFTGVLRPRA